MPVVNELLKKETLDLVLFVGVLVGAVVIILGMLILFFKIARVEKIGIGGIECDPEDEKPARKVARKKAAK